MVRTMACAPSLVTMRLNSPSLLLGFSTLCLPVMPYQNISKAEAIRRLAVGNDTKGNPIDV